LVFFEAIGGELRTDRCGVVPDLKQQDMVRVLLRDRDTKLTAAQLIHGRSGKLLDRCHELVDLCGDDVELDNKNVVGAWLFRRLRASLGKQPRSTPRRYRRDNDWNWLQHWSLLPSQLFGSSARLFSRLDLGTDAPLSRRFIRSPRRCGRAVGGHSEAK